MRTPTIHDTDLSLEAKRAIQKFSEYNGFLFHQNSISKDYLQNYIPQTPKRKDKPHPFILGSKFIIRHPITKQLIVSPNLYEVTRTNVSKKTIELNRRINNYFVSQSYELMETYLYSVAATLCIKNKRKANAIAKMINCADKKSYRKHLKDKWKNIDELYSNVIIALLPKMKDFLNKNKSFKNFQIFLTTMLLARHAITHNESNLKISDVKVPMQKQYLKDFFGVDLTNEVHRLTVRNMEN